MKYLRILSINSKYVQLILTLTIALPSSHARSEIPPAATQQELYLRWSQAYLMDSVFLAEYQAILNQHSASNAASNAASSDSSDSIDPTYLKSKKSADIWVKAKFAVSTAKAKGQRLLNMRKVKKTIENHGKKIKKYKLPSKMQKILRQKSVDQEALFEIVADALSSKTHQKNWKYFNLAFQAAPPTCTLDFKEISKFAQFQKKFSDEQRTPNASELLNPLRKWKIEEVQCLIFAFMSASPKSQANLGFEPMTILVALRQTGSAKAKNEVIMVNTAIRFLQRRMYAEALRILVDLQEKTPAYRLAYDTVQRIFSIKQRGSGKVAIKGL